MPEPNEYLALRNLQAALQGISVAGGYYYDVAEVAVKLDPNSRIEDFVPPEGARPFILIDVQPDAFTDFSSRPTRCKITMPVHLYWINESESTVDESFLLTYFRGCADVEKAIVPNPQRGGYAFETRIVSRMYVAKGSQVWARVEANLIFGRTYGQPS